MAASISQMNPLCVKFFIFFSETFLALRLSGGSVLPPNSWSLPCGSIPLKDDDEVDVESVNKFFNMAMCEEYPKKTEDEEEEEEEEEEQDEVEGRKGDRDNSGDEAQAEDDDQDIDEGVEEKIDEEVVHGEDKTNEDEGEEEKEGDEEDEEDEDGVGKSQPIRAVAAVKEPSLYDALFAEEDEKEKADGSPVVGGERQGTEAVLTKRTEMEIERQKDAAGNTISSENSDSKRRRVSLPKDTRLSPASASTSASASSALSPPLKIEKAMQGLYSSLNTVTKHEARKAMWGNRAGTYALVALFHLYFTCSAAHWNVEEGNRARDQCSDLQEIIDSAMSDDTDVRMQQFCPLTALNPCLFVVANLVSFQSTIASCRYLRW
jgi:hypothetical protein